MNEKHPIATSVFAVIRKSQMIGLAIKTSVERDTTKTTPTIEGEIMNENQQLATSAPGHIQNTNLADMAIERQNQTRCCEPLDRARAEAAFANAYRKAGLPAPYILWVNGPKENQKLTTAVSLINSLPDEIGTVRRAMLKLAVRRLFKNPRDRLFFNSPRQLSEQRFSPITKTLKTVLYNLNQLAPAMLARDTTREQVDEIMLQHSKDGDFLILSPDIQSNQVEFIALHQFIKNDGKPFPNNDAKNPNGMERLRQSYTPTANEWVDILYEIEQSTYSWFIHKDIIVACERPLEIKTDEENNLHCIGDAALKFRDGSEFYRLNGKAVPKKWAKDPNRITAQDVINCEDVDMRAIGAQIVGWAKILKQVGEKVIDDSGSETIGSLITITMPGTDIEANFLKAKCPRNGTIVECVPLEDDDGRPIRTALHAQAWRVGLSPEEYRLPEIRT